MINDARNIGADQMAALLHICFKLSRKLGAHHEVHRINHQIIGHQIISSRNNFNWNIMFPEILVMFLNRAPILFSFVSVVAGII